MVWKARRSDVYKRQKYSLASRELIADSVETMAMAHCFDGLVLVPNCDKIVPGMVIGHHYKNDKHHSPSF